MKTRRSVLSLTLEEPGPDEAQIQTLLEIATRVPDHGKLAPWRFIVFDKATNESAWEKALSCLVEIGRASCRERV